MDPPVVRGRMKHPKSIRYDCCGVPLALKAECRKGSTVIREDPIYIRR
jgi:hypothetical protein